MCIITMVTNDAAGQQDDITIVPLDFLNSECIRTLRLLKYHSSIPLTLWLTNSLTLSLTHPLSFIHSLTHPLSHSLSLTHSLTHSLTQNHKKDTHSHIHSLTHSLTHLLTNPLTHSLTHSLTHPFTHKSTRPQLIHSLTIIYSQIHSLWGETHLGRAHSPTKGTKPFRKGQY